MLFCFSGENTVNIYDRHGNLVKDIDLPGYVIEALYRQALSIFILHKSFL